MPRSPGSQGEACSPQPLPLLVRGCVARGGGADKATTAADGAETRGVSTPTTTTEREKRTFRERTRTTSSKEILFFVLIFNTIPIVHVLLEVAEFYPSAVVSQLRERGIDSQ